MASVFKGLNVKIDAVSVWIGGYIMRIQAANTFYGKCKIWYKDYKRFESADADRR